MSGGTDTSTTLNVPEFAIPFAQNYMQRAQQVADLPYTPYTGQTVAGMNPYQTGAYDAIAARAMGGSPINEAAGSELTRTLSGGYLNANPHLDRLVDLAGADVRRNMDVLSARGAGVGNSGVQEATARALADASTRIRGEDYARERGYMQGAIGMAPTIAGQDYLDASQLLQAGQGYQTQEQRGLDDTYRRFMEAQNYPLQQLNIMGRGLGMNLGSTTTMPGANPWAQGLGAGLAAYGAYNNGGGK